MNKKSLLAIILATLMLIVPGLGMVTEIKAETIKANPAQDGWILNNVSVNGGDQLPKISGGRQEYQIRSLRGIYDKTYKNYVENFIITIKNPGKGTQRVIKTSRIKLESKVGIKGKDDSYSVNLSKTEVDNTRFKLNFYPGETGVEMKVEVKDLGDKLFNLSTRDKDHSETHINPDKTVEENGRIKNGQCTDDSGYWGRPPEHCKNGTGDEGCPCRFFKYVSQGGYTEYFTDYIETLSLSIPFYDRIYENFDDGLEITYPASLRFDYTNTQTKKHSTVGKVNEEGESDNIDETHNIEATKSFYLYDDSVSYYNNRYIKPTLSKDVQYKVTIGDEEEPVLEQVVKSGNSNSASELDKIPRGAHVKFNNPYKKSDGGSTGGTVVVPGGDSSAVIELMKQIQAQITELEKKVAVLETKNTNIELQLKELKDKTVELEKKNTEINSKLQSLEEIKNNISNLQKEVNKLSEEKKALENKVNNINTEIAATKEKINNLEKNLSNLTDKSEIEKVKNSIKENKEKLEKLENSKVELEKSIANNTNKINETEKTIENNKQIIQDLNSSIKVLENEKVVIENKIKEIVNNESEAKEESLKLKEQITSLNNQLISLTQTLKESTEKQSKEVERQKLLLEKRIERLTKEVDNQSDVKAQIAELIKQIEELKKRPINPGININGEEADDPAVKPSDKTGNNGIVKPGTNTEKTIQEIIKYLKGDGNLTPAEKELLDKLINKQNNSLTDEEKALLKQLLDKKNNSLTAEELKELKALLEKQSNSLTKEEKALLEKLIIKQENSLTIKEREELERLIENKDKLNQEELARLRELLEKKDNSLTEAEKALLKQLLEKQDNSLTDKEKARLQELLDKQNKGLTDAERALLEKLLSKQLNEKQIENIRNIINTTNKLTKDEKKEALDLINTITERKLTVSEEVRLIKLLEKIIKDEERPRPPFGNIIDSNSGSMGGLGRIDSLKDNKSKSIEEIIAENKKKQDDKDNSTEAADKDDNKGVKTTGTTVEQLLTQMRNKYNETSEKSEIIFPINANYYVENNEKQFMDAKTFIANGRTMLPIRYVANVLGFSVQWNQDTRTITFTNISNPVLKQETLTVTLDGTVLDGTDLDYKTNLYYVMDQAPVIIKDRTYVSISNLIKAFGGTHGETNTGTHTIEWDSSVKSAIVRKLVK